MTCLSRSSRMTTDIPGGDVSESDALSAPLMCGLLRPRILLPRNWKEWSPSKLRAVLIHERAHIRRGDALVAFLARLNCAIFWFHPVSWWLERKLATLAEHACDDEVVKKGRRTRAICRGAAGDGRGCLPTRWTGVMAGRRGRRKGQSSVPY